MKNTKTLKIAFLTTIAAVCAVSGVFAINANTVSANTADFHELGASVRAAEDKGIRFAFGLSEQMTGEGYEIGTLVIPKSVLGENELNHNSDTADTVTVDYQAIPCTKNWVPHNLVKGAKEGYNYYNAALTSIPNIEYNTVLVARSYYLKDGVYTYSAPVERSIGYVASAALNDGYEDTKGILNDIVTTGFGETALSVAFKNDLVSVADEIVFTATNELNYKPIWSTSDASIATVDKDGNVEGVKGGEAMITATIGETTATQKVYVAPDRLYADQIGMRVNGWNQTNEEKVFKMETGENDEMVITAKYTTSWEPYHAGLVWNNIESKEYYQKLVDNGYTYITFDLAIGGDDADKVDDLYLFCGQQISNMPYKDGVYKAKILISDIVRVYDAVTTFIPNNERKGQIGARHGMLLAWRDRGASDTAVGNVVRNYVFTISNSKYTKDVLFADDFGFRDGGVNKTSEMDLTVGENGEIIINVDFTATETYGSFLMFNNMNTITYLGGLKGKFASFTFELTVGGKDAGKVSDLHVFGTAKKISDCNKVPGKENTYVVEIRLDMTYFTASGWKTNMNTFATSTGTAGSWDARSQMLLAWRYSGSSGFVNPNNQTRNYTFTISNFELRDTLLYSY